MGAEEMKFKYKVVRPPRKLVEPVSYCTVKQVVFQVQGRIDWHEFLSAIAAKMKLSACCAAAILAHTATAIPRSFGGVKSRNPTGSPCAAVSSSAAAILAATPSGMVIIYSFTEFL